MYFQTEIVLSIISRKSLVRDQNRAMALFGGALASLFSMDFPLQLIPLAAGIAREVILEQKPELKQFSEPGQLGDVENWKDNAFQIIGSDSISLQLMPETARALLKDAIELFPKDKATMYVTRHGIVNVVGSGECQSCDKAKESLNATEILNSNREGS